MKRTLRTVLTWMCILCVLPAFASDHNKLAGVANTLSAQLKNAATPGDSILLMQNLFDIYSVLKPHQLDSLATRIYLTALAADDVHAAADMLRQRSNINTNNDSIQQAMLALARQLPVGQDRSETIAFIRMKRNYLTRDLDDRTRSKRLHELLTEYTLHRPSDVYEQLVLLHAVCVNIAKSAQGDLLVSYMDRLQDLLDELPQDVYSLRNLFQVVGAINYIEAGQPLKAIELDKKLLQNVDSLESFYTRQGRPYRNYDANRYIIYTRMLSNWRALTPEQVEEFYSRAMELKDTDTRARNTYKNNPRPDIFHAMANKDYERAKPLLRQLLDGKHGRIYRRNNLRDLIECARQTNDQATIAEVSLEYIDLLQAYLDKRLQERYKELQILYDVYEMQQRYDLLRSEKIESEHQKSRIILFISLAFIIILVALLITLARMYRRKRTLAQSLEASNEALRVESANLRNSQTQLIEARDQAEKANAFKTMFIRDMSREINIPLKAVSEYAHLIVDCSESSAHPYLERYSELVDLNCELLTSIINDVLHLSEIDSDTVTLQSRLTDIHKICSAAVDMVERRARKGVTISYHNSVDKIDIYTDPRRVQQILVGVLSNAVKFTPKGTITVDAALSKDGKNIIISVADTGIGIPPEQAEYIFERFVKLDKEAQGVGLGLTISRMLARMLGGDLTLDTTYTHGARFVLILPVK